jgi:hypothetical protein
MSKSHPNNGPSFSKSTVKRPRITPPSPDRQRIEQEDTEVSCAKTREFNVISGRAWANKYLPNKR